jgi:hypothetical protein
LLSDIDWGQIYSLDGTQDYVLVQDKAASLLSAGFYCRKCYEQQDSCKTQETVEVQAPVPEDEDTEQGDGHSEKFELVSNSVTGKSVEGAPLVSELTSDRIALTSTTARDSHSTPMVPGEVPRHGDHRTSSDYTDLCTWTQRNETQYHTWNKLNRTRYTDPHAEKTEPVFRDKSFLCRVVDAPPECGCHWEVVHSLRQDVESHKVGVNVSIQRAMTRIYVQRGFTQWGWIRWRTVSGAYEEALLSNCELLSYEKDLDSRSVVWGHGLLLLIFGVIPLQDAQIPQYQLRVAEGMARSVVKLTGDKSLNLEQLRSAERHATSLV